MVADKVHYSLIRCMCTVRFGSTVAFVPLKTRPEDFLESLKNLADGCKNLRPFLIQGNIEDFLVRHVGPAPSETLDCIVDDLMHRLHNITSAEDLQFIEDVDDNGSVTLYGFAPENISYAADYCLAQVCFGLLHTHVTLTPNPDTGKIKARKTFSCSFL